MVASGFVLGVGDRLVVAGILPLNFSVPQHRRALPVLDLDPVLRRSRRSIIPGPPPACGSRAAPGLRRGDLHDRLSRQRARKMCARQHVAAPANKEVMSRSRHDTLVRAFVSSFGYRQRPEY
jgi:hypothetical protein